MNVAALTQYPSLVISYLVAVVCQCQDVSQRLSILMKMDVARFVQNLSLTNQAAAKVHVTLENMKVISDY